MATAKTNRPCIVRNPHIGHRAVAASNLRMRGNRGKNAKLCSYMYPNSAMKIKCSASQWLRPPNNASMTGSSRRGVSDRGGLNASATWSGITAFSTACKRAKNKQTAIFHMPSSAVGVTLISISQKKSKRFFLWSFISISNKRKKKSNISTDTSFYFSQFQSFQLLNLPVKTGKAVAWTLQTVQLSTRLDLHNCLKVTCFTETFINENRTFPSLKIIIKLGTVN